MGSRSAEPGYQSVGLSLNGQDFYSASAIRLIPSVSVEELSTPAIFQASSIAKQSNIVMYFTADPTTSELLVNGSSRKELLQVLCVHSMMYSYRPGFLW